MNHVNGETLMQLAEGNIADDSASELARHVAGCEECGSEFAVVMALHQIRDNRALAATRRKILIAASVVLLVGAFTWFGARTVGWSREPSPEAALASRELPHPGFLQLRFGTGELVDSDDFPRRLSTAARALWAGEFESSLPELERLHRERPGDPEVAAYLGISLYLSESTESPRIEALLLFGRETPLTTLSHYSSWYLANHHLQTGTVGEAVPYLVELAGLHDYPATRAAALLERLEALKTS